MSLRKGHLYFRRRGGRGLFRGEERARGRRSEGKGEKNYGQGKGEVDEPGPSFSLSSRLRLFRLGGYRCNQVHALYSASVRFLEIYRTRDESVCTRPSVRVRGSVCPCLCEPRRKNRRKKEPPRYVGRSLIMSDRESVILKTIMVSAGVIYILLPSTPSRRLAYLLK